MYLRARCDDPAAALTQGLRPGLDERIVDLAPRLRYRDRDAEGGGVVGSVGTGELMIAIANARPMVEEFLKVCVQVRIDRDLYKTLFEVDTKLIDLYQNISPLCFGDL